MPFKPFEFKSNGRILTIFPQNGCAVQIMDKYTSLVNFPTKTFIDAVYNKEIPSNCGKIKSAKIAYIGNLKQVGCVRQAIKKCDCRYFLALPLAIYVPRRNWQPDFSAINKIEIAPITYRITGL